MFTDSSKGDIQSGTVVNSGIVYTLICHVGNQKHAQSLRIVICFTFYIVAKRTAQQYIADIHRCLRA